MACEKAAGILGSQAEPAVSELSGPEDRRQVSEPAADGAKERGAGMREQCDREVDKQLPGPWGLWKGLGFYSESGEATGDTLRVVT